MKKEYEKICAECRQVEKAFNEFNYYCTDIQTSDLQGETRQHIQELLQAELHRKVTSAIIGIEYSAQAQEDRAEEQEDRIQGYKEQAERQRRQITYLQDVLQAERTEHRSEEEYQKTLNDLQEEKRKRIEAEWKLAVYMIKH